MLDSLAALALLSTGVLMGLAFYRAEVREVRNTQDRFAAILLCESEMERLRTLPYERITVGENQTLALTLPAARRVKGVAGTLTVKETEPGLKQATVTIAWRSPKDRPLQVEMSSLFARAAEGGRP